MSSLTRRSVVSRYQRQVDSKAKEIRLARDGGEDLVIRALRELAQLLTSLFVASRELRSVGKSLPEHPDGSDLLAGGIGHDGRKVGGSEALAGGRVELVKVEELEEDESVGRLLRLGDSGGDGTRVLLLALSFDTLVASIILGLLGLCKILSASAACERAMTPP